MTLDDEYNVVVDPETGVPIYPDVTDDSADFERKRASIHHGANYLEQDVAAPWGSTHGDELDDAVGANMSDMNVVSGPMGSQHIVFSDEMSDAIGAEEILGFNVEAPPPPGYDSWDEYYAQRAAMEEAQAAEDQAMADQQVALATPSGGCRCPNCGGALKIVVNDGGGRPLAKSPSGGLKARTPSLKRSKLLGAFDVVGYVMEDVEDVLGALQGGDLARAAATPGNCLCNCPRCGAALCITLASGLPVGTGLKRSPSGGLKARTPSPMFKPFPQKSSGPSASDGRDFITGAADDILGYEEIIGAFLRELQSPSDPFEIVETSAYDRGLDEIVGAADKDAKKRQADKKKPVGKRTGGTAKDAGGTKTTSTSKKNKYVWKKRPVRKFESKFKILKDIGVLASKVGQKAVDRGSKIARVSKKPKAQALAKKAVDLGKKTIALSAKLNQMAASRKANAQAATKKMFGSVKTRMHGEEIFGEPFGGGGGGVQNYVPDDFPYDVVPVVGNEFFPEGGITYDGSKGFPAYVVVSWVAAKSQASGEDPRTVFCYVWDGKQWARRDSFSMTSAVAQPGEPGAAKSWWDPNVWVKNVVTAEALVPVTDEDVLNKAPYGPDSVWGPLVGNPAIAPWAKGLRFAYQEQVFWWPAEEAPDWAVFKERELQANKDALEQAAKDALKAADDAEAEEQGKTWEKEDTLYQRKTEVEERDQALLDAKAAAEYERAYQQQALLEAAAEAEVEREFQKQAIADAAAEAAEERELRRLEMEALVEEMRAAREQQGGPADDPSQARAAQVLREEAAVSPEDVEFERGFAEQQANRGELEEMAEQQYNVSLEDGWS